MSRRFDGILLCTDFDGTLAHQGHITKENADAVRYFQKEGGIFTVISGRFPDFIREFRDAIVPNTYVCGMNGACISGAETGITVYEAPMGAEAAAYSLAVLKKLPAITDLYFQTQNGTFHTAVRDGVPTVFPPDGIRGIYKILFVVPDAESDRAADLLLREAEGRYAVSRSWRNGLEIQRHGIDKGSAVRFLREKLADSISYVVGIGDYENDIPLLLASDLRVAEQNAIPAVKQIADKVTSSCTEDSVARVIYEL